QLGRIGFKIGWHPVPVDLHTQLAKHENILARSRRESAGKLFDFINPTLHLEGFEHELHCAHPGVIVEGDLGAIGVHELAAKLPQENIPDEKERWVAERWRITQ